MSGAITAAVVIGAVSANQQKQAAIKAADAQRAGVESGISEERRQFDITQKQAEPFRQAELASLEQREPIRQEALSQQAALLGLSGQEAQTQVFQQLQESPGQQFIRQRQERALLRNQAAIGGLGGGNVRTALQQQAAGFAQQDIQNQFSRLGGFTGAQGAGTTQNLALLGQTQAGNISNLLQAGGQAQASGILGAGAAQSRFTQQFGGALVSAFS